jgi:hypothetical protein
LKWGQNFVETCGFNVRVMIEVDALEIVNSTGYAEERMLLEQVRATDGGQEAKTIMHSFLFSSFLRRSNDLLLH